MTRIEWVPGAQHAIVRDGLGMLLADDVPREQVLRVWQELDGLDALDGLGGLLDILRDVTGRGLGSLPSFAMSVIDHRGLHVAVRGSFNAHVVDLDDDEHVVRGDEASVWVERNFDTAVVADVLLAPDDLDGTWLPVVGGVLPAAGIRQCLAERTAASGDAGAAATDAADPLPVEVEPAPAPDPEPDPAPEPAPSHETWVEDAPAEAGPATRRFASLLSPHTVMHDVEEAAVRPYDPELDDHDPAPSPPAEERADAEPPQVEVTPVAPVPVVGAPVVPAPAAPAEADAPPSFISGVPSRAAYVAPAPAAPAQVPEPSRSQPASFGEEGPEHHDGHTMLEAPDSTELDAYLSESTPASGEDLVLGLLCAAGHGNPTHRTECRVCGQRLAGDSVRFPRPALGLMHTSAGESIELVQNVLAGRNPRASRIQGTVMPRLLPLPHSHVSGTHLEIRLEGWSVMVVDLGSTNGTFLQRPGQPTLRISETPQLLHSDDVVQLGHGVDLRFEGLP